MSELDTLYDALKAIEKGDLILGKRLLLDFLSDNPRSETGWLMVADLANSDLEETEFLQKALSINPVNRKTQKRLKQVGKQNRRRLKPKTNIEINRNLEPRFLEILRNNQSRIIIGVLRLSTIFIFFILLGFGFSMNSSTGPLAGINNNFQRDVVTKAPGKIVDAILADSGRIMILRYEGISALGVYDTTAKALVHTIHLSKNDDFVFTAGGNVVLVYYPENNLLQTWDLKTFEKARMKSNPLGNIITSLTMGHSNDTLALVRYADGKDPLSSANMYLLDINTLSIVDEYDGRMESSVYRDPVHQRADGMLKVVSEWEGRGSSMVAYRLSSDNWGVSSEFTRAGYMAVGDDKLIYTSSGSIFDSSFNVVGSLRESQVIPGIGGIFYLSVEEDGALTVYPSGSTTPLYSVGMFPEGDSDDSIEYSWYSDWTEPFAFDRHIFFNPLDRYILFIPSGHEYIVQRSFDLGAVLEVAGADYLFFRSMPELNARSGEEWRYEIEVLSNRENVEFSLELGPESMVIEDGQITWNVPPDYLWPTESVVLLAKTKTGVYTYQTFELRIAP